MTARQELEQRLPAIPGVTRKASRSGRGLSYFAGGRETAHFHGETRMDVRLTKEEIQRRKSEGTLDLRVITRGPSAEWVEVHVRAMGDVAFVLELVKDAARANS
jgi:Family of unknown function (DUF5519)